MERTFRSSELRRFPTLLIACFALSAGCSHPQGPPEHTKQVDLKPGEVVAVSIPGASHPRLEVTADRDIDLALVYADDPATEPDKVVSSGRVPKRYQGREFHWSYTGIEKEMKLLLRSIDGATVTIRYAKPL